VGTDGDALYPGNSGLLTIESVGHHRWPSSPIAHPLEQLFDVGQPELWIARSLACDAHHGEFWTVALPPILEGLVPPKQQEKSNDSKAHNRNCE
jgi:hypothetical protein